MNCELTQNELIALAARGKQAAVVSYSCVDLNFAAFCSVGISGNFLNGHASGNFLHGHA
jgi:hypothetical protein